MLSQSVLKAALACCAGLFSIGIVSAQTKVGIVNIQKAIVDTAEIKKAQLDLQAKYKPRQDEMEKAQKDLENIQAQLQNPNVSPQGQQDLQARGQRRQRELQRLQEDLQGDVDRDRNDILQRAGQRMTEIVKQIADAKGLDIVIDTTNAVYFKPALEITTEATAAFDKAYPVK